VIGIGNQRPESGLTLLETLLSLMFLGVGLLGIAPLFVHASQDNSIGADLARAGAAAVLRMEQLREEPFDSAALDVGGSLTVDVTAGSVDYFDTSDPEFTVRWLIENNTIPPGTKVVTVRATMNRRVVGRPKQVTVTSLRGPG
jgi:hypothetical protein